MTGQPLWDASRKALREAVLCLHAHHMGDQPQREQVVGTDHAAGESEEASEGQALLAAMHQLSAQPAA